MKSSNKLPIVGRENKTALTLKKSPQLRHIMTFTINKKQNAVAFKKGEEYTQRRSGTISKYILVAELLHSDTYFWFIVFFVFSIIFVQIGQEK